MRTGCFVESPEDPHVGLRSALLAANAPLTEAHNGADSLGIQLADHAAPLADDEFLALGRGLGEPLREDDPAVQPFVRRNVILDLVSEYGQTDDVRLQPFGTNYITLHTESSARPLEQQPRFIVLMCIDPGERAADARTIVVPMERVAESLSAEQLDILMRTRYERSRPDAPLARAVDGRVVFAFRDFAGAPLKWAYAGGDASEEDVNSAIRALLGAMYAPDGALAVRWRAGLVATIDNTRCFHGRTAASDKPPERPRHLRRLRILDRQ